MRVSNSYENRATDEGRALGKELARLCDIEAKKQGLKRERCGTCAFRAGDHLANGSPETLMTALKCTQERHVFGCHEANRPCVGWRLMVADVNVEVPWPYIEGAD